MLDTPVRVSRTDNALLVILPPIVAVSEIESRKRELR
jgi:hypothetical protein